MSQKPLLAAVLATALLPGGMNLDAAAQQAQAPATPQAPGAATQFTFTANSRLVIESVYVNDKNGKAIEGLSAKDFTVTEDNVPQTVTICDFQKLEDVPKLPNAPVLAARPAETAAPAAPPVASATGYEITPDAPGDKRYDNRRLLVLYFDMTAMPVPDQLRALDYAEKFVKTRMLPSDMFAVMEYDGSGVKVKQDFSSDRDAILATVDKIVAGEGFGFDEADTSADASDTGSAFGQDDSEFNIFNTNRQLAAIQTAVNMLAPIQEAKSFVYFASGLNLNGLDNQAQLTATENSAVRANVRMFPVDARGLVALPPMGDASHGSPGGVAMYNGSAMQAGISSLQHSQDTLYSLGADTGGKALLDNNDLGAGIVQAEAAITSYYVLGYYSANGSLDGKYRKIKITYNGDPNARISYRTGYYAGKVFAKFTEADKERQLEDALMLGDPITDLTVDVEVNYFQLNQSEYFVPIAAKIPGSELALAKSRGAEHSVMDFIGEVKDEYGTTITNLRDIVDMKLTGETASQLAHAPIVYTTGTTLLPGNYTLKLLARDNETGRIGTFIRKFNIPNFDKVAKDPADSGRLALSSIVLGSQHTALADALFNAKKDTAKDTQQAANPLVTNGQELIPSVTRVFSQKAPLYVFLQAYERSFDANSAFIATSPQQPLVAFVSFYQGGQKIYDAPPQPIAQGMDPKSKAVPINFNLSLASLKPGRYTCQVTVVDPNSRKAGFAQVDILVVP